MSKYFGIIGFSDSRETRPGIWEPYILERAYYGDVIRDNRKMDDSQQINSNLNINNQFSIIADPYSTKHFHQMKYLIYMGIKWKITSIEVQYPRLLLSVGGEYNEEST